MIPGVGQSRRESRDPMTTSRSSVLPIAAWLIAGLFGCTALAGAADKPRQPSVAKGKTASQSPLLTQAQLRDCLAKQEQLRGHTQETARQQAAMAASKSEIDRLGVALKEQMATLDRTSADAVATYNEQAQARDKQIDEYQEAVPAFNAKVEALKAEQAAYSKSCESRRYDEDDEIAIRKGK